MSRPAVVALTDRRWYDFLKSKSQAGRLDEVNFWRPMGAGFRALHPGEPFFLRLKHPVNAIAGYGYFAHFTLLPIQLAWMTFDDRNGDSTFEKFLGRIAEYRKETPAETLLSPKGIGCIVLRDVVFLDEEDWLPWSGREEWQANIVAYKGYDLDVVPGAKLQDLIHAAPPPELQHDFSLMSADERSTAEKLVHLREGQGAFRLRVLDAYGRRCAVTGERSLPVLEAAHIQSYLGPGSNHVQNGLSLRADIHRLFDTGYVTVTPDLKFEVSKRLREDFENGRHYYELAGKPLSVLPRDRSSLPARSALDWHGSRVFRA